jgi:hypothetical protein
VSEHKYSMTCECWNCAGIRAHTPAPSPEEAKPKVRQFDGCSLCCMVLESDGSIRHGDECNRAPAPAKRELKQKVIDVLKAWDSWDSWDSPEANIGYEMDALARALAQEESHE